MEARKDKQPATLPHFKPRKPPRFSHHPAPGYVVRGRMWVEKDGEIYLGSGRISLLEQIDQSNSISAAARAMNMSYRHAWLLVEAMNRLARAPLVEKRVGGPGGGSAVLTEAGQKVLGDFKTLQQAFLAFIGGLGI